ncbi:MAG: DUF350 domain-containing protein, partial [Candidatus Geothermarchaeales archaeon]
PISLGLNILGFIIVVLVSIAGLYLASFIFDRLTGEINEWEEIGKGNLAVAIFMASVFTSIALIITPGVRRLYLSTDLTSLTKGQAFAISDFTFGLVQLIVSLTVAVIMQYIGVWVLTKMTVGIDEWGELKKGNMAVGALMGAAVIAIGIVVGNALEALLAGVVL